MTSGSLSMPSRIQFKLYKCILLNSTLFLLDLSNQNTENKSKCLGPPGAAIPLQSFNPPLTLMPRGSATWPPRCHRRRQAAPKPRGTDRPQWLPHGQCQPDLSNTAISTVWELCFTCRELLFSIRGFSFAKNHPALHRCRFSFSASPASNASTAGWERGATKVSAADPAPN